MTQCPICSSSDTSSWSDWCWQMPFSKRDFHYRNCSDCGTVFCDPLPTEQELKSYYRDFYNYDWFEKRLPLKKIQAMHRWQRLQKLFVKYSVTPGSLLDTGCGHGLFLSRAKRGRWTTTGIDYPSSATRYASEKQGLKIVEGDLRSLVAEGRLNNEVFDFVTAWHFLEHDTAPLSCLESFRQVLVPGGKILIAAPNADSSGMKLKKEFWVWCQEPYVHIFHFTEKSLSLIAGKAGLKVLAIWTRDTWDAHPLFDVYASMQVRRLSNKLGRFSSRAAFWFEESVRLACYAASCHQHWLCKRERADHRGSELLMLAERA